MTFDFLVVCHVTPQSDLLAAMTDVLRETLEENLNEFDDDALRRMMVLTHRRSGDEHHDDNGDPFNHEVTAFRLELPDETASAPTVMDEFTDALAGTPPVVHVLRFEDPLVQAELARLAAEIYALEMKLRRVLSIVYLHANQTGNPYDLLCDESVQPMTKPTKVQMQPMYENQFFHLTFSNYVSLNQRPEIKQVPTLLELIRGAEQYEEFRKELQRKPVEKEDDAVLLAGLKERMDAIEKVRNCVAHNRRPSRTMLDNYINARPLLNDLLDQYLARWSIPS
jgi:hypothetical protein